MHTNDQDHKQHITHSASSPANSTTETSPRTATIATLDDLAQYTSYSLMDSLNCDPDATASGADHTRDKYSRATMFPSPLRQSKIQSMLYTATIFFVSLASLILWHTQTASCAYSPAISQMSQRQCARLAGHVATHFLSLALNTPNSAHSKPATAMATVAQCQCLKPSSMVNAGKCS